MNYKRLFLNWIKQNDPQNIFEFYLKRNNQTIKNHVKNASNANHLIMVNSFSWLDTIEGFIHWANLYTNWLAFYDEWTKKHQKSISYEL